MARNQTPIDQGAHTDFRGAMSYSDYLCLDQVLDSQKPVTEQHDEMLFVIIHQATELWMKLMIHEARGALDHIRKDDLPPAFKMLSRISRIQAQLIQSWDVLSTMTPSDYLAFRDKLGQSSGFQSYQYRTLEFMLGNKRAGMLAPHEHRPDLHDALKTVFEAPSLYDETLRLLARRGFNVPADRRERDWTGAYKASSGVTAVWREIYGDMTVHWDLYELGEKLVDLEDWFRQWRFRHLTTVARIIGERRGTGGTEGVGYLRKAMDIQFFPELWDVRTEI
jgi:tryptophan 2,3-dioxygenase